MFSNQRLINELRVFRDQAITSEDKLILQAQQLLKQNVYSDKSVLENLEQCNKSFEDLYEGKLEKDKVFKLYEIKKSAILNRIKFLDLKYYKPELPYPATLQIEFLNQLNRREIKSFKILAPAECFRNVHAKSISLLFAKTSEDNYYLIHQWGKELPWYRKLLVWPLRNFENLVTTIVLSTLILTISIPTRLITLDHSATYWSGYRAAAFFHLLIFNFGVTVYFTFTLAKNFSSAVWNQYKDFD